MPWELDAPDDDSSDRSRDDDLLVVAVARSGGVAGLRRRWRVETPAPRAQGWIALIERCPWDAPAEPSRGADRYVWSIRVHSPDERRERELPDSELSGAWRELVDAVRDADGARDDASTAPDPSPRA